jgi:DNA repair exonuclease SbcCD ATPase subunit
MNEAVDILEILTEVAPLALSTLILASVLLFVLWLAVKLLIPAMREAVQMSEAQRLAWQAIVKEQERFNQKAVEELRGELTDEKVKYKKLAERVSEMDLDLTRKDTLITELQNAITKLNKALDEKDETIRNLRKELEEVKADRIKVERERGELLHRMETMEKAQAAVKPDESTKAA